MGRMALLAVEAELVAVELPVVELAVRSWDRIRRLCMVADIRFRKLASLVAGLVSMEQYSWVLVLHLCSNMAALHHTGTVEWWVLAAVSVQCS